jgi:hypothetical protein
MPMRQRYDESTASLKDVMTADPISPELHAAVLRRKVDARRLAEDAREAAKQRQEESL